MFGDWMAHSSPGEPAHCWRGVFTLAAVTTAVLSLDATVVLLTPVVLGAARALHVGTGRTPCDGTPGQQRLVAVAGLPI